ncbi:MAG TPA: DUF4184 family protein [Longimicrobium sp.]|nr:DUF4184 family protein [Longimicrobium sp.]
MPITPAHAAAAWPLHGAFRRLPASALVIGTMSPDLQYVLRLEPVGKFGHTPAGLFLFCLPVTLVLWWAWRATIRPALTPLLPAGIRAVSQAPPTGRASDAVPLAVVAALVGAATHILWDGFTHDTGWAVALFPVMRQTASQAIPIQWFSLAQYVSTVVGSVIVAVWIVREWRRWPREARRFAPGEIVRLARVALFLVSMTLAVGAANAMLASDWISALARLAVGSILGVAVALTIYAAWAASRGRMGPH